MPFILFAFFLLVLIIVAVVGYYYGRGARMPAVDTTALMETAKGWAGATAETTQSWAGTVRGWLPGGRPKREPAQFVAWAAGLPGMDDAFKAWVESLAPNEVEMLIKGVTGFGFDLNVDLAWLWSGQLDPEPELKHKLQEAVALYCRAYWRAALLQDDAKVFAAFLLWQANPRRQQALTQRLLARLVETGAVSAVPPELYLAPEAKRWDYTVKVIRDYAEQDRSAFMTIFREALGATPPEPAPPEPPAERRKKGRAKSTPSPSPTEATP